MAKTQRVIWQLSDGKAGHDEQATGLVCALSKLISVNSVLIQVSPKRLKGVINALLGFFPEGRFLPRPDIILGAGSSCISPLVAAKREYGGRSIYIMDSGLPERLFDLNIVPRHDHAVDGPRCIPTEGPMNSILGNGPKKNNSGLILIGGTSKHYKWAHKILIDQIDYLIDKTSQVDWTIVTSRRTPASSKADLSNISLSADQTFMAFDKWERGGLRERLNETEQVWVTRDSISMIYEALTAGCTVGILDMPIRKRNRVTNVPTLLKNRGWVRTIKNPKGPTAAPLLSEATRCAFKILTMWPELGERASVK